MTERKVFYTPGDIEVLIHYHVSPKRHPRRNAPAVVEAITHFVKNDILREVAHIPHDSSDAEYELTDRGRVWLSMMQATPMPVAVTNWVDPRTNGAIGIIQDLI